MVALNPIPVAYFQTSTYPNISTTVVVNRPEIRSGQLTQEVASRHVEDITASLFRLEDTIESLPEGPEKARLKRLVLIHHNYLGRGGQSLNDHFQTAQISPNSAGGDKGDNDDVEEG